MNFGQTIREAWASARASRVPSALIALLAVMMCAGTLATVGRTVSAEREIQARMDDAGSKVVVLRDLQRKALFPASVVDATDHLSVTDRAVGISVPMDVVNGAVGPGSTAVPAWTVIGRLPAVAHLVAGRWPRPGEALVSQGVRTRIGLVDGYGWVTSGSDDIAVVGTYRVRSPFNDMASGVLIAALPDDEATALHVVARDARDARRVEALALAIVGASSAQDLGVDSPVTLAELQQTVGRDLGGFNRSLVLGVMGVGAALVGIVVLADVLLRRKDLGRRRALGATRATIVALVVLRTALPALVGAVVGAGLGLWVSSRLGASPGLSFAGAVGVLSVLAAVVSAVAPAVFAARRDPVEVLRTP